MTQKHEKQNTSYNSYGSYIYECTHQILIDGWQLMTLEWHRGCNYNGVA